MTDPKSLVDTLSGDISNAVRAAAEIAEEHVRNTFARKYAGKPLFMVVWDPDREKMEHGIFPNYDDAINKLRSNVGRHVRESEQPAAHAAIDQIFQKRPTAKKPVRVAIGGRCYEIALATHDDVVRVLDWRQKEREKDSRHRSIPGWD